MPGNSFSATAQLNTKSWLEDYIPGILGDPNLTHTKNKIHTHMPLKAPPKHTAKLSEKRAQKIEMGITPDDGTPDDGLPNDSTSQVVSMTSLGWLFVGPPGFGKSEFFSCFPDSLMLACEAGHKFIKCPKVIIDGWGGKEVAIDDDGNRHMSFETAMDLIENSARYKFIYIDTLDALIKKCVDHHIGARKAEHLSDLGDYGKGFDLGQNDPVRKALNRLFSTGRGLGLITHQQINTSNFKKKGPESKKETSLPNGIFKIVYPQMDIIIHGEYGGVQEGNKHKDRIIKSEGDEDILAKNRGGILPGAFISPLDMGERAAQIVSFFQEDENDRKAAVACADKEYRDLYVE